MRSPRWRWTQFIPRVPFLVSLIVLSSCLQSFTSSILLFAVSGTMLSSSLISLLLLTHLFADPAFSRVFHLAEFCALQTMKLSVLTITTSFLRYFLSLLDFAIRHVLTTRDYSFIYIYKREARRFTKRNICASKQKNVNAKV